MHVLDLIIYIVLAFIIWYVFLPEDYREELGAVVGIGIMIAYTVIYLILFVFMDWNWIDIFHNLFTSIGSMSLKW